MKHKFHLLWMFLFIQVTFTVSLKSQYSLEQAIYDAVLHSRTQHIDQLNAEIARLKVANTGKQFFPQLGLNGQATYQSDVTALPFDLPNIEIDPLARDQYRIQGEVRQLIYDGGTVSATKEVIGTSAALDYLQSDITRENLREQVIRNYFAILELQNQLTILDLKAQTVTAYLLKVQAAVDQGAALSAGVFELKASLIGIRQQEDHLKLQLELSKKLLSILTGKSLTAIGEWEVPATLTSASGWFKEKPVFKQLELQKQLIARQYDIQQSLSMPKVSLFLNLGYGRPGLNMLDNTFAPYYLGGFRVQWNFNNLYTKPADRSIMQMEMEKVEDRKVLLTEQLEMQKESLVKEISLLSTLMASDHEVLELRVQLRAIAEEQFEQGVITAADLMDAINREAEVKQLLAIRTLQSVKYQYLLNHLTGQYLNNE